MPQLELEFTFLAKQIPTEIYRSSPIKIVDNYIPESGVAHPNIRIRQNGDKFEITKKIPVDQKDSSRQHEYTIPLSKKEFDCLSKAGNRSVVKDRYQVKIDGYPAEVDVFRDKLEGLVLIDFEFASVSDLAAFKQPDICLADVTQDEFIAGGMLAGKSYADIKPELEARNYQPLSLS